MRILDRQRYWAFAKAYVICFVALVGLYVVLDAFEHIDEFTRATEGDGTVGLMRYIGWYYLIRMSLFYDRLCGVIAMMAAIFTVTWMQRNNELLAMLAAGIGTRRAIRPVLVAAVGVAGLSVANQEYLMPRYGEEFQRKPEDEARDQLKIWKKFDADGILIHGDWGYPRTQVVAPFFATLPASRFKTDLSLNLEAKEARWVPDDDHRSPLAGGWLLRGVRILPAGQEPKGDQLVKLEPEDMVGFPPPMARSKETAKDLSGPAYFLSTDVSFAVLVRDQQWYWFAGTADLIRTLRDPYLGETEKRAVGVFLHGRMVRPLASLALLMLSLPLVLGGDNRGMFINLGLALGTSALFYAANFLFQYLGNNRVLSPELAAWIPLILFGTLASARWDRIRS